MSLNSGSFGTFKQALAIAQTLSNAPNKQDHVFFGQKMESDFMISEYAFYPS